MKLDKFTLAYIQCALWSTTDNSNDQGGDSLDKNYSIEDLDQETLDRIIEDCKKFQDKFYDLLCEDNCLVSNRHDNIELAGHDFWLTRNHHGSGFWDGNWVKEIGETLTQASHEFGEVDLYIGDDDKLYI